MLNIFRYTIVLGLIFLPLSGGLFGQYDIATFSTIKDEYPDQNIIKLSKYVKINIEIDKGELDITETKKDRVLYLKNSKGSNPVNSAYTSTFRELINYEANSYVLEDGGKYKKIPVKNYDEVKSWNGGVFFDDHTELVFTYPGIAEGSVIELNTEHKIHEPRFSNIFLLNEYYPTHDFELIIECDKNVDLDFVWKHVTEDRREIEFIEKGKKKIYKIRREKLNNVKYDEHQPDILYFTPHIIPIIKSYTVNGEKISLLENTGDLHKWYYSFVKDLNSDIDRSELQQIVGKHTSEEMTELEKVKSLFYWVQKNIKYIAFEDGMGGLVPRKADEVLKKRYGDCKDKTSILYALLKEADIESYYTWIGSRDLPYKYSEITSPIIDNHMILTYIHGDDYYFLDGTGKYQPLDIPTSFIQGKEALISIGKDRYEIRPVPVVDTARNKVYDQVRMKLNDGMITGEGQVTISGLSSIQFQYLTDTDDKEDQKKAIEELLQKGSNQFVLTEYQIPEDGRFAEEYILPYEFELNNYAQTIGDELYLNLNLSTYWLEFKLDKDKESPFELENTFCQNDEFIFEIPEGYQVQHLPEKSEFTSPDFSYQIDYRVTPNNEIIYSHKVWVNKIYLETTELETWNTFISSLEKAYKKTILIQKIQ